MSYADFFQRVTGVEPYPWQQAMVHDEFPDVVDVPTGLGKTAGVAVAWLYRHETRWESTPMRLVYCLPMRTLVTQTVNAIEGWVANTDLDVGVYTVMGGDVDDTWADHPEKPAVIVGTQDMLLSRALNRGFGMSRYAWPVHFSFLHNDALWVFDEIQLMGVGVETSAQLEGLRQKLGTARPSRSVWMSATVGLDQLRTIDHPDDGWTTRRIGEEDTAHEHVQRRIHASKRITRSDVVLPRKGTDDYPSAVAQRALELHEPGTLTAVIVNRVSRAVDIYQALLAAGRSAEDTTLIHGRFRPQERRALESRLHREGDHVLVSTQVIEAGVDLSAQAMVTELAPWPSIVQRAGRCNRYGEAAGRIEWIDAELDSDKDEGVLPYSLEDLVQARTMLAELGDASPAALSEVEYEPPFVVRPVVRRRDLLQLFDTTPDLTGTDLDVSRWVRDSSEPDVMLCWRELGGEGPKEDEPAPTRDELCRVSIGQAAKFVDKRDGWMFDPLDRKWVPAQVRPGAVVMLDTKAGGYDEVLGFTGDKKHVPTAYPSETDEGAEAYDDNTKSSYAGAWLTVTQHLNDVANAATRLARGLRLDPAATRQIELAARWHDVGKAHPEFQRRLLQPLESRDDVSGPTEDGLWAKSNHRLRPSEEPGRRYFRHELVSALAFLQQYSGHDRDLIAYLIAAHHGKIRLTIRSMPDEERPKRVEGTHPEFFAVGVWHEDELPAVELGNGTRSEHVTLDLSLMRLGQGSWRERTLGLLDEHGPFALGWLESLVRVADWWGSSNPKGGSDEQ